MEMLINMQRLKMVIFCNIWGGLTSSPQKEINTARKTEKNDAHLTTPSEFFLIRKNQMKRNTQQSKKQIKIAHFGILGIFFLYEPQKQSVNH